MTISALGEIDEIEHIRRKLLMKQSVLEACGVFVVIGLTRTHLQIRFMKLSAVGERAE
jgi:hypothetical protein